MRQERFEALHGGTWTALEAGLDHLEAPGRHPRPGDLEALPTLYRQVCHHLALARRRRYGPALVERLNGLALRGHQRFYAASGGLGRSWVRFLTRDFPRAVRTEFRLVLLAAALFYLPFGAMTWAAWRSPEAAARVVAPEQLARYESMYRPTNERRFGRKDEAETDVMMFAFYVGHNVRITFQTFAAGLAAGLGAIFFLFWNGLDGGAVAGHLTRVGCAATFWPFVATHSALEINGLVLGGAAGLRLGLGWLLPGRRRRLDGLRAATRRAMPILYGGAAMVFFAAFFEAFWSSSALVPPPVKLGVAATLWSAVLGYFLLAGRDRRA